ncbi:hypothetical protein GJ633_05910 [Halorubrum sp. CBA1125]|uniref:hypothetical protein n=1 Tax=Halorubrum sp. CBA1125 TaxID=2668072 RepID=UPI0012E8173A|nr:hypothetical protein [Halorubrum sp. CBA1125]MUW14243.1 hypothetical protein [Halorubrum sp. CBA1125]
MVHRRTTVLALGTLLAGGGAVIGTGAFDSVEAQRSVSLETADDADAFLAFEIIDDEHVNQDGGTINFELIARATTTFADLVNVRNQGTQTVTSLRFEFGVTGGDQPPSAVEDALRIISGNATIDAVDEINLLAESDAGDADDDELSPGEAIPFGIEVDLTGDIHEITGDPEITLTIIADTGGEGGGGSPDEGSEEGSEEDSEGPTGTVDSVSLADGNGNDIDVTVTTSNVGEDTQLRIQSLRPESSQNPNTVRDEVLVDAENGENTYSVLGSNGGQADRVRVDLIDEDGTVLDARTVSWSQ